MLCAQSRPTSIIFYSLGKHTYDMHVIVYLRTYLQPKTIKIIYKIFTKFKDLSTLKIFTRPGLRQAVLPSTG